MKLQTLSRQIENTEHEIQGMIEHKRHTHDQKVVADLMRSISERHKALAKATQEYEEVRRHVRFEHPERNDTLDRKYIRHEFKSIERMEKELGIHGRLDQVKSRVLAIFPLPKNDQAASEKKSKARLPASKPVDEDAPEKIHLSK